MRYIVYRRDWHSGSALDLYLRGVFFESRAGHRLSWLGLPWFSLVFLHKFKDIINYVMTASFQILTKSTWVNACNTDITRKRSQNMNCVVFISLANEVSTLEANSDTIFLDWTQSGQSAL